MAEKGITLEYFNSTTIKNSAEKINKTIGKITPPNGKGFGVESALTNLEQVDTTITQSGTAVKVHTLDLTLPTEQSVADAILDAKVDLLDDVNAADSELQTQITSQAARITELNNIKLNKNLGSINSGKILFIDSDGNVVPASGAEMGGLIAVAHDQTLEGAGTDADPLRVSNSLLEDMETTQNNLSDLGDQVQGIEEKIPENASPQNQMATKSDITNKITNCITEIPQDIKLEIVDGAVVLKAGSKVYVPNGAGVFNVVTIANDIVRTTNIGGIVFVNSTGTSIYTENLGSVYSGDSAPSSGGLWYDTANNLVKYSTNGQSWSGQYSFPIGIVSTGGGQITSIDQVFNGFGYIGSTVFALPGVKGLTPDGRNEEGTLKNVYWTTSSIILRTYSSAYSGEYDIFFNGGSFGALKKTYVYDEESNYNMDSNNRYNSTYIGRAYITSGTISYFATKNAFHAVDYSEYKSLDNKVSELNSSISSVDSSAVHQTGDETVAGTKTFTAPYLQVENQAGSGGSGIKISDSNGKGSSELVQYYIGGNYYTRLVSRNTTANKYAYIEIIAGDDGNMQFANSNLNSMSAPTPASTSNSTDIATTAWVRTNTSNVVRLVEEQKPTSENSYTWYRKYSDGWVEQGGIHHRGSAGDTVNLPIAMSNEYYELQLTAVNPNNINRYAFAYAYTSTYFKCGTSDDTSPNNDGDLRWYICGYAAQ